MNPLIVTVPLDSRPVNTQLPESIAACGGYSVVRPPLHLLGNLHRCGNINGVIQWLETQLIRPNIGLVLSIDFLAYGGLIFSRKADTSPSVALENIGLISSIKNKFPDTKIFAFSTILRDAVSAHDPASFSLWKKQMNSTRNTSSLIRSRNIDITKRVIQMAGDGIIDFLVIGKEDTARNNPNIKELETINSSIKKYAPNNAILTAGADELSLLMTARAAVEYSSITPTFKLDIDKRTLRILPVYEPFLFKDNLIAQITACGGKLADSSKQAKSEINVIMARLRKNQRDLFLDQINGKSISEPPIPEKWLKKLEFYVSNNQHVGLIDADRLNGSSTKLINELLARKLYFKLSSYAAWNTTGNSSGTVIAHLSLSNIKNKSATFNNYVGTRNNFSIKYHLYMAHRLLDDYQFATQVRDAMIRSGIPPFNTAGKSGSSSMLKEMLKDGLSKIKTTFPDTISPMNIEKAIFPWNRLFECDVMIK